MIRNKSEIINFHGETATFGVAHHDIRDGGLCRAARDRPSCVPVSSSGFSSALIGAKQRNLRPHHVLAGFLNPDRGSRPFGETKISLRRLFSALVGISRQYTLGIVKVLPFPILLISTSET